VLGTWRQQTGSPRLLNAFGCSAESGNAILASMVPGLGLNGISNIGRDRGSWRRRCYVSRRKGLAYARANSRRGWTRREKLRPTSRLQQYKVSSAAGVSSSAGTGTYTKEHRPSTWKKEACRAKQNPCKSPEIDLILSQWE
jgi:hypothetical protein